MCMNSYVSHQDVARAAGVCQSTVSRVLSGKDEGARITPETRDRVRSVARQLGYQPGRNTRFKPRPPTGGGQQTAIAAPVAGRVIGLVVSLVSPASTLALIPCQEPVLAAAGFNVVMMTLPADPLLAQGRVTALTRSGVAGLLCCPSVYSTVMAIAAGACPLTAISPWSASSLLKSLGVPTPVAEEKNQKSEVRSQNQDAQPEPKIVAETHTRPPVVAVPEPVIPVVTPVEPVVATAPVVVPEPVVVETPIVPPVVAVPEPVIPVVAPVEPVVVPEPVVVETPTLPPVVAVPESVIPVVTPVEPVVAPIEPVVVPEPIVVEKPTLPPVVAVPEPVIPVVTPVEPVVVADPVVVETVVPLPDPVPVAAPVPEPTPVAEPAFRGSWC